MKKKTKFVRIIALLGIIALGFMGCSSPSDPDPVHTHTWTWTASTA